MGTTKRFRLVAQASFLPQNKQHLKVTLLDYQFVSKVIQLYVCAQAKLQINIWLIQQGRPEVCKLCDVKHLALILFVTFR